MYELYMWVFRYHIPYTPFIRVINVATPMCPSHF